MIRGIIAPGSLSRYSLAFLAAGLFALLAPSASRADLIITVGSAMVAPGSTGDGLDVTLTNTGPDSVDIGGFTFELTVGNTDITLTDVTIATMAPYIFGNDSLFGPSIAIPVNNQDIEASDLFAVVNSGTTIGSGETYGLGHLVFDVSAGATFGTYPVMILGSFSTTLSDFNGNPVEIGQLVNGNISVVPEPASLALLGTGLAVSTLSVVRRRRRNG